MQNKLNTLAESGIKLIFFNFRDFFGHFFSKKKQRHQLCIDRQKLTKIDHCALPSPTQKWKKAKPPTPSAKAAKIPATDVKQRPPKMAFCLPNRSATRPKTTQM